ncbi:MAG TPA: molybdopterin synthase sulfur carrier subunit [Flavobacteriaceae bacterium]|jgi:molybdopterin synthase sulfur carrier subunit|nr:molybdopterin synthase sulfur carrier subunit [Flavobacteriaceae bacterium]HBS11349.1 molybdopterin synthase sulfur carrier subunit [Flavobacteriaceae bacterium]
MKIQILFFGILKDIVGKNTLEITEEEGTSIAALKAALLERYTKLNDFSNFSIAVNEEYVTTNYRLKANDTVALIPPVSGG